MNISEKILFEAAYNAFVDLMALETPAAGVWSQEYAEAFGRFSSLYDLIESVGLEEEYQEWKKEKEEKGIEAEIEKD